MLPRLDRRCAALLGFIREGAVLFDVGCDHAKVSVAAVAKSCVYQAFASDINEYPLILAHENALCYLGLESHKITILRRDGIPAEAFSIVGDGTKTDVLISGMGGELIMQILSAAPSDFLAAPNLRLILSPQSHQADVRGFLSENNFAITDEAIVPDKRRIYQIIVAEPVKHAVPLTLAERLLGPRNIERGERGEVDGAELRSLAEFLTGVFTAALNGKRAADLDASEEIATLSALNKYI